MIFDEGIRIVIMFGLGVDITSVEKFSNCIQNEHPFMRRFFTNLEILELSDSPNLARSVASKYCVKESVAKAWYSIGYGPLDFRLVQVLHTPSGIPMVEIQGMPDGMIIRVSVSHDAGLVIAFALIEMRD